MSGLHSLPVALRSRLPRYHSFYRAAHHTWTASRMIEIPAVGTLTIRSVIFGCLPCRVFCHPAKHFLCPTFWDGMDHGRSIPAPVDPFSRRARVNSLVSGRRDGLFLAVLLAFLPSALRHYFRSPFRSSPEMQNGPRSSQTVCALREDFSVYLFAGRLRFVESAVRTRQFRGNPICLRTYLKHLKPSKSRYLLKFFERNRRDTTLR